MVLRTILDLEETIRSVDQDESQQRLTDPALYTNFQLSWLAFNARVLEEAEDLAQPLLERAKFLAIVTTNTDEFFNLRVAGLRQASEAGSGPLEDDGLTPTEVLAAINVQSQAQGERQLRCLHEQVLPALARENIHLLNYAQLDERQRTAMTATFKRDIAPVLTPLAIDTGHPFPFISNQSLNLLIVLGNEDGPGERVARLRVPPTLPRLVRVEAGAAQRIGANERHQPVCFVWLEQVIAANIQSLFTGIPILATFPFRVLRNGDLEIQADEAGDLLQNVKAMLRQRPFGFVTCLTVDSSMPDDRLAWLHDKLEVGLSATLRLNGPLGLSGLMSLLALDRPELKDPPLIPRVPRGFGTPEETFETVGKRDVLLHHPYDSFEPVVGLINAGAQDPAALGIKQTLYRVGRNSPIVEALGDAREANTEVAVLVELKARFDEESNVGWAQALEAKGVHVVYGLPGLKVHSKVAMVVRREGKGLRRYLHLGTGNYNAGTARLYTDLGLLTSRVELADETAELFNSLTGYSDKRDYETLLVSPVTLRERMLSMIEREADHAREGRPSRLIFKMNQLTDGPMIRALYRASQASVRIDLLVRGVCCLRPGIPGVSDSVSVTSIVGRFLEHGRIYYFTNGGDEEIYMGSADLMPRNLDHRVEVVFPLADPVLRQQVRDGILGVELADTVKARRLRSDGTYERVQTAPGETPIDSQAWFLGHALDETPAVSFATAGSSFASKGKDAQTLASETE
jgi:polyphosphate kinase